MAPHATQLAERSRLRSGIGEAITLKVALVSPYSLTLPGGVQGQVLGLARALRSQGVDAVVVGPCDGVPPDAGVVPVGRSIPLASNGSVAPIAPDPAAMLRTAAALRDERPDVLHLHEPITPGPTWAALLRSPAPSLGTFHASGSGPGLLYQTFRPVVRALARRLDARTAVSDDARALAERFLGGAYRVLPNAVDVETFAKAEPWPTDDLGGRPIVLFVGRHEERKGLDVLVEAFSGLDRDAVLWVAGEGPQTHELQARGVPGIEWLGMVSDEEKAARMRAATVFCAPSVHGESFGIVLLEAMAAGTPVVASEIPGYRDVARAEREGVLAPPRDPAGLQRALRRVLDDPSLGAGLVEAGRERAAAFSMQSLAERYRALYASVIATHTR